MIFHPDSIAYRIYLQVRNYRLRLRSRVRDNPLIINIAEDLKNTAPVRFRARVRNLIETKTDDYAERFRRRFNVYAFKRRFLAPGIILAGFMFGFFYQANHFGNIYVFGAWNFAMVPQDYTKYVFGNYQKHKDTQYDLHHRQKMIQILEKEGELDTIDWLQLGVHYANKSEEEIAFQLFYMAHLQDH